MNLIEILQYIVNRGAGINNVNSAFIGDVYELWNTKEIDYSSVVVSVRSAIRVDNSISYNLVLYYGDRLLTDNSNKTAVWQDSTVVLQTILNSLEDIGVVETPYTIEFFEQKFLDLLAGGYVIFNLIVESVLGDCEVNEYSQPIEVLNISSNGEYDTRGYDRVIVAVSGITGTGPTGH